jgi:hypothetical protein
MQSPHETFRTLHRQPVLPNQFPHHSPFQSLDVEDGLQLFKETQRNVRQITKALLDRRLANKLQVAPPTRLMTLQKIPHYGFSSRSIPSRFDVSPAHTEERPIEAHWLGSADGLLRCIKGHSLGCVTLMLIRVICLELVSVDGTPASIGRRT